MTKERWTAEAVPGPRAWTMEDEAILWRLRRLDKAKIIRRAERDRLIKMERRRAQNKFVSPT